MLVAVVSIGHVAPAFALDSVISGATADASLGATPVGDALMFELGAESAGLRSYGVSRWLFQWDALVAGRGGYLANEHPFFLLIGLHGRAWGELGIRLDAPRRWSPYVGARLGGDFLVMPHPGLSLWALDTVNSVDGVGGVVSRGIARVDAGLSLLDGSQSLLLTAFVQEALDAPETNTPGYAFTEGGVGARCDMARRLFASLEFAAGAAPPRTVAALGLSDRTWHAQITTTFWKVFGNGMWIGASAQAERKADDLVYAAGSTYRTADPPTLTLTLLYGLPLWKSAR